MTGQRRDAFNYIGYSYFFYQDKHYINQGVLPHISRCDSLQYNYIYHSHAGIVSNGRKPHCTITEKQPPVLLWFQFLVLVLSTSPTGGQIEEAVGGDIFYYNPLPGAQPLGGTPWEAGKCNSALCLRREGKQSSEHLATKYDSVFVTNMKESPRSGEKKIDMAIQWTSEVIESCSLVFHTKKYYEH